LQNHGALADIAEAVEDREFFLLPDPEGLIEIAAGVENVGDLAGSDGSHTSSPAASNVVRAWRVSASAGAISRMGGPCTRSSSNT
jgi:hypothetical protein